MNRREFSASVKRAALDRAQGQCEAVGAVYELPPGSRCTEALSSGVEFDHYPIRAVDGGDNSLGNCVAVCRTCHRYKTRTFDIPMVAKSRRIRAKAATTWRPARRFSTNRMGPFRRRIDGTVEPR